MTPVADRAVAATSREAPASLRIAQFATAASGGGAEAVARTLHDHFRERGHDAELWVGRHAGEPPAGVHVLRHAASAEHDRLAWRIDDGLRSWSGRLPGAGRLADALRSRLVREAAAARRDGREDFAYPGVWALAGAWRSDPPDIIHAHNLHGGYFDLRVLPTLSRLAPLALTLHDQWLLTGHCAHGLSCERWRVGCGACPDLGLYPAITRDGTAANWDRKREVYAASQLHVAAPSQWLLDRVADAPLAAGVVERRLIRIGVDRAVFTAGDRQAARARLGLPADVAIVMFAAHGTRANPWKDFATLERAVERLPGLLNGKRVVLLAIGQAGENRQLEGAELRMLPFERDRGRLADFYRAADVYLHATRADNSPIVVIEALACGTPVVASAVGGIPELVDAGQTGWLAPVGDAEGLAQQTARLLLDSSMRAAFSRAALDRAARDFDVVRQIQQYLEWFAELAAARSARPH